MSWCDGRHALVTGGGSGIGAAIAKSLRNAGANVTLVGRNEKKLLIKAQELGATYQVGDVHEIIGLLTKMDMVGLMRFTRTTDERIIAIRNCP